MKPFEQTYRNSGYFNDQTLTFETVINGEKLEFPCQITKKTKLTGFGGIPFYSVSFTFRDKMGQRWNGRQVGNNNTFAKVSRPLPTIYDIKYKVEKSGSKYFKRETLRFFGQTLKSFSVSLNENGEIQISAPIYHRGKFTGAISKAILIGDELETV